MSHHHHEQRVPRAATFSVLGLILLAFAAVLVTRAADIGTTPIPLAEVEFERALLFEDHVSGSVNVFDANSNALIHVIPAQTGHFVRVMLRSMVRERRDNRLPEKGAFKVSKRADGFITLEDTVTGRTIVLRAFGETNAAAFSQLLTAGTNAEQSATVAVH